MSLAGCRSTCLCLHTAPACCMDTVLHIAACVLLENTLHTQLCQLLFADAFFIISRRLGAIARSILGMLTFGILGKPKQQ